VALSTTVSALGSTTIDPCRPVFPRAGFHTTSAAVKLRTLLELRGAIPAVIHISAGELHDVYVLVATIETDSASAPHGIPCCRSRRGRSSPNFHCHKLLRPIHSGGIPRRCQPTAMVRVSTGCDRAVDVFYARHC
jgi:hypothetical protein